MPTGLSTVPSDGVTKRLTIPPRTARRQREAQQSPGSAGILSVQGSPAPMLSQSGLAVKASTGTRCLVKFWVRDSLPEARAGCGTARPAPGQHPAPLAALLPVGPAWHRAPPAAAPGAAARGLPRRRGRPRPTTRRRLPGSRIRARPQCAPPGSARRRPGAQGAAGTIPAGTELGRESRLSPRIQTAFLAPRWEAGSGGRRALPLRAPAAEPARPRAAPRSGQVRAAVTAPAPGAAVTAERGGGEGAERRGGGGGGERREGVGEQEGSCEPVWG